MFPRTILVFGAGNHARRLASALVASGTRVGAFISTREKFTNLIDGIPVYNFSTLPEELAGCNAIACGVLNEFDSQCELEELLKANGFSDILWPQQYYAVLGEAMGWCYWLDSRPRALAEWKEQDAYRNLRDSLEDDESKDILDLVLNYRAGGDLSYASYRSADCQYFNELSLGGLASDRQIRYLDIGAYDGDSLLELCRICDVREAVLLKPDPVNFSQLVIRTKGVSVTCPSIDLLALPIGAGSRHDSFPMHGSGSGASVHGLPLDQSEKLHHITVAPLDQVLIGRCFDFVKIDVEGHDLEAIKGMKNILQRSRPAIAASVYHRPHDIFDIPTYIMNLFDKLSYRYFLRQHSVNSFDLTFYATPIEP